MKTITSRFRTLKVLILYTSIAIIYMPSYVFANILNGSADLVLGQPEFTSNIPAATPIGMNYPTDVAVDTNSARVYVCDGNNHRVLWWNNPASLTNGKQADGVIGQPNLTSNSPACSPTGLNWPQQVYVDGTGNVWISDYNNNRVLKFPKPSGNGQAASRVLGQTDFTSNAPATTQTGLKNPYGVRVDVSGNVWVADTFNFRVLKYSNPSSDGQAASLVLGQPDFTSFFKVCTSTGLSFPLGIDVDGSGNVWVADAENYRVLKYTVPINNGQSASLVLGQTNFTSKAYATSQTGMNLPYNVCVDSSGNVWISDTGNNRVLKFDNPSSDGQAASLALGQSNFTSNSNACTQTGMYQPYGVDLDNLGIWIADNMNNRILRFNFAMPVSTGALAGKVINAVTLEPLSGAAVTLLMNSAMVASATTDNLGNYSVTITSGTYDINAVCAGYVSTTKRNITVVAEQTRNVDFSLDMQVLKDDISVSNPVFDTENSSSFPIELKLLQETHVQLKIIGPSGKVIKTLVDNAETQGVHIIYWDSKNEAGTETSSGVYLIQLVTRSTNKFKKVVLIR